MVSQKLLFTTCFALPSPHGMAGCKIPTANTQNKTNEILGTSLVEMGHRNQSCKTDFYVTRMAGFVPFRMEDAFWSLQMQNGVFAIITLQSYLHSIVRLQNAWLRCLLVSNESQPSKKIDCLFVCPVPHVFMVR